MRKPRKAFIIVFIVVLAAGLAAIIFLYPRSMINATDANQNGNPETVVRFNFVGEPIIVSEDLNDDGSFDRLEYFSDGVPYLYIGDQNMDGFKEITTFYTESGDFAMLLRDKDKDGEYDIASFYDNGRMPALGIIRDKDKDGIFEHSRDPSSGH